MYFFDCFDGVSTHRDEFGIALSSEAEVREQAGALALSILRERDLGRSQDVVSVSARVADGRTIYTAQISFVGRWADSRDAA